jgi:hypothetical protein
MLDSWLPDDFATLIRWQTVVAKQGECQLTVELDTRRSLPELAGSVFRPAEHSLCTTGQRVRLWEEQRGDYCELHYATIRPYVAITPRVLPPYDEQLAGRDVVLPASPLCGKTVATEFTDFAGPHTLEIWFRFLSDGSVESGAGHAPADITATVTVPYPRYIDARAGASWAALVEEPTTHCQNLSEENVQALVSWLSLVTTSLPKPDALLLDALTIIGTPSLHDGGVRRISTFRRLLGEHRYSLPTDTVIMRVALVEVANGWRILVRSTNSAGDRTSASGTADTLEEVLETASRLGSEVQAVKVTLDGDVIVVSLDEARVLLPTA